MYQQSEIQKKKASKRLFGMINASYEFSAVEVKEIISDLITLHIDDQKNTELIDELTHLSKYYEEMEPFLQGYYINKVAHLNPYITNTDKKEIKHYLKSYETEDLQGRIKKQEKIKKVLKLSILLKRIREVNNLSTEKLSQISGVSGALINKIENAKITSLPKHTTLTMLANALNVDVSYFNGNYNMLVTTENQKPNDLKSILLNLGYEAKYAKQILEYADLIMLKQKLDKGEINV